MRAINHALTGAIIGLTISEPVVAIPVAFLSHFLLDVIPHYGQRIRGGSSALFRSKTFNFLLGMDIILCFALVVVLDIFRPWQWQLGITCAFFAAAPDLFSINHFIKALKHKHWKASLYAKFAGSIQWFERPIGAFVELAWLIACLILLVPFLR